MEKDKKELLKDKLKGKFAILIRTKRGELGKSQEDFAADLLMCDRTISYVENHEKLISTTTLFTLLAKNIITLTDIDNILSEIKTIVEEEK